MVVTCDEPKVETLQYLLSQHFTPQGGHLDHDQMIPKSDPIGIG
jgi:hypothetical protein